MNGIIKTSNDLTNLLERISTLNQLSACLPVWATKKNDMRYCVFVWRLLLNPIRVAIAQNIVMQIIMCCVQWWHSLCTLYTNFSYQKRMANKPLTRQKGNSSRKLLMACLELFCTIQTGYTWNGLTLNLNAFVCHSSARTFHGYSLNFPIFWSLEHILT